MKYLDQTENYYGYVYVILDQKYNKIYVGQKKGKGEETQNYYGSGIIIRDIIKSRGKYYLKKTILGVCYSKEELDLAEIECISFFNSNNFMYGYNLTLGGEGANGRICLEETRLKIKQSLLGHSHTEESLIKMRESKKDKNFIPWNKGLTKEENNKILHSEDSIKRGAEKRKGRKHTEESKQKMGRKGRKYSEESKQKMSISKKGKKFTEERKKNMRGKIPWNKGMNKQEMEKYKGVYNE